MEDTCHGALLYFGGKEDKDTRTGCLRTYPHIFCVGFSKQGMSDPVRSLRKTCTNTVQEGHSQDGDYLLLGRWLEEKLMNYFGEKTKPRIQSLSRLCRCKLLLTLGSLVILSY